MWIHLCVFVLSRRPPGSTRTDTLSYTTLVRSVWPANTSSASRPSIGAASAVCSERGLRSHGNRRALTVRDAQCASSASRSEEHTAELQSLMRIAYAVFCLKQKPHQTPCQHLYSEITDRNTLQYKHGRTTT